MNLSQLLRSLSESERNFIAGLDYGMGQQEHRAALDAVIEQDGVLDFDKQGYWYPYEVIELGKNWLQPGHEREYAACVCVVLRNIEIGGDRSTDIGNMLRQQHESIRQLPKELRQLVESLIERVMNKSEPDASAKQGD